MAVNRDFRPGGVQMPYDFGAHTARAARDERDAQATWHVIAVSREAGSGGATVLITKSSGTGTVGAVTDHGNASDHNARA